MGTVAVFNSQRIGGVTGPLSNITGTATPTDEPGQYGVKFDVQPSFVPPAPYWVVALGPINADSLYDYAIVTDNKDRGLYVLARDVQVRETTNDAEGESKGTCHRRITHPTNCCLHVQLCFALPSHTIRRCYQPWRS